MTPMAPPRTTHLRRYDAVANSWATLDRRPQRVRAAVITVPSCAASRSRAPLPAAAPKAVKARDQVGLLGWVHRVEDLLDLLAAAFGDPLDQAGAPTRSGPARRLGDR